MMMMMMMMTKKKKKKKKKKKMKKIYHSGPWWSDMTFVLSAKVSEIAALSVVPSTYK